MTIGILNGGGSLLGFDYEVLIENRLSAQIGFGLIGFGAGLNIHFRPTIRSSCVSFQYYHQGLDDFFIQNLLAVNYIYRESKMFTFQIGLGVPLKRGPGFPDFMKQTPVILTYSIGIYYPLF
jgi:hypothetical protein